MPMKKDPEERFGKVISIVDGGVDPFQVDEVAFNPIHSAKYLISIFWVQVVGFWALYMAVHPLLSSYTMVAASCGMSRSQRMLRTKKDMRTKLQAAINSALVEEEEWAIVGWNLVLYAMVPPVRWMQMPLKE